MGAHGGREPRQSVWVRFSLLWLTKPWIASGGAGEEEQGELCLSGAERRIRVPGLLLPVGVQGAQAHPGPSAREFPGGLGAV